MRRFEELQHRFDHYKASQERHYDPVGFTYMASMFKRLLNRKEPVTAEPWPDDAVLERLHRLLSDYERELEAHRQQADLILADITGSYPAYLGVAEALYEKCNLPKLRLLQAELVYKRRSEASLAGLKDINQRLNTDVESRSELTVKRSLDDVLHQQEQRMLTNEGADKQSVSDGKGEQLELQAMQQFRTSMKYFNIDQLILRAINECPENPGPHNPQMLAVKSLMRLRDLSPHYLRRFAGYIETMLWLEKNATKLSGIKKS